MENSQRVWILYIIVFSLNVFTVKVLSTDAHLIVWASKMNQDVYYKGILTSEFGTEDMML